MQGKNTKSCVVSQVVSTVKYVFAIAMFGAMVLMVVATFVAIN